MAKNSESYTSVCINQLRKNKEFWMTQIPRGQEGQDEFMKDTDPHVRNIKITQHTLESMVL
jgi:hypothetical protein